MASNEKTVNVYYYTTKRAVCHGITAQKGAEKRGVFLSIFPFLKFLYDKILQLERVFCRNM